MSSTTFDVHVGIVVDNNDEEQRGRLKVASATLCGIDDNGDPLEYPDFIEPLFPYLSSADGEQTDGGWFFIPSVGTFVELRVPARSTTDQIMGAISFASGGVKWQACLWPRGDTDGVPEEFKTNYPNRRGIKTQRGHFLLFDDTEDKEKISLECVNANGTSYLSFNELGDATLATSGGQAFVMDDANKNITLISADSMMLNMSPDGMYLASGNGKNMFTIAESAGSMNIMAETSITLQSTSIAVNGGMDVYNVNAALASSVIKNGIVPATAFTALLSSALLEVVAIGAAIPAGVAVPAVNCTALSTALLAGTYTATALKTE